MFTPQSGGEINPKEIKIMNCENFLLSLFQSRNKQIAKWRYKNLTKRKTFEF